MPYGSPMQGQGGASGQRDRIAQTLMNISQPPPQSMAPQIPQMQMPQMPPPGAPPQGAPPPDAVQIPPLEGAMYPPEPTDYEAFYAGKKR